ncbi:hypothetical protein [Orenia marismortui]|uniref:hypothetical protein n=1 Tax=Orenia marismortui TaxID=46469 RepID=UPI001064A3F7|nr:hypothetical protein [Orenia marismortui]
MEAHTDRINKLELAANANEDSIKELSVNLSEYKAMAHNIIEKIDNLENRLFSFLTTITKNQSKEDSEWKDLIWKVIAGTIVVLVAYLVGKGGA